MKRMYPIDPASAHALAARRRALGLSQNALALAAALTEGAVSKYETLRCPIPPEKRDAMERALAEAERKGGGTVGRSTGPRERTG